MITSTQEICELIEVCPKVMAVMDTDLPSEIYYAANIREMCRRCRLEKYVEKRNEKGE